MANQIKAVGKQYTFEVEDNFINIINIQENATIFSGTADSMQVLYFRKAKGKLILKVKGLNKSVSVDFTMADENNFIDLYNKLTSNNPDLHLSLYVAENYKNGKSGKGTAIGCSTVFGVVILMVVIIATHSGNNSSKNQMANNATLSLSPSPSYTSEPTFTAVPTPEPSQVGNDVSGYTYDPKTGVWNANYAPQPQALQNRFQVKPRHYKSTKIMGIHLSQQIICLMALKYIRLIVPMKSTHRITLS